MSCPPAPESVGPAPSADRAPERRAKPVGGRPPKYTEAQWAQVASDIGMGMPVRYACVRAKVPIESYQKRLQQHPTFFQSVEEAKAAHLFTALQIIGADLPGHVGQRWLLERRHAADFHKPADIAVNVSTSTQVGLVLTPELQGQLAAIARKHFTKAGRN